MEFQLITLLSPLLRPQAYLDPSSGSLIIQLLIAGLLGAGIILKTSWKKIKSFFTRSEPKNETAESINDDDSEPQ